MNTEEYSKIIAANLRRLAYEHGKSQAEVAKDIGINKQTLSSWMNGVSIPRIANLDRLCKYFHCLRTDITEPYLPKPLESFSAFEKNIINAYRNSPEAIQESVLILLGMKERG